MQAFAKTDIGCVRIMNQDACFCSPNQVGPFPNLFIVADGMGGHKAGDYASRYSIEYFLKYVRKAPEHNLIRLIDQGLSGANRFVYETSLVDRDLAGMGTTFIAAYIDSSGELYVANVGDSRAYLIGDEINQVTEDHSYVAEMVRAGEITPEEARNHPDKNIITRAIGVGPEVRPDFFEVDLKKHDRILLCTDGLSNMVPEDELYDIIRNGNMRDIPDMLIEAARAYGGFDNITALVIEPFDEEVN
ncbi:MAG: Stp1/IreP family PP2C-type Ser/Thr phosphatase [Lachnospiraceae bacterium]|nr:Stp1/IreP family PP2C-type Ser/Thr phosphatase [Lachnospiraceae bacterium]